METIHEGEHESVLDTVMHTVPDGEAGDIVHREETSTPDKDLRPDLCAEAFSPRFRLGLLFITLLAWTLISVLLLLTAFWPRGLLDVSSTAAVWVTGGLVGLCFFLLLVYGAMVGNNPHFTQLERGLWYTLFLFAAPVAMPAYWLMYVQDAPYEPWPRR